MSALLGHIKYHMKHSRRTSDMHTEIPSISCKRQQTLLPSHREIGKKKKTSQQTNRIFSSDSIWASTSNKLGFKGDLRLESLRALSENCRLFKKTILMSLDLTRKLLQNACIHGLFEDHKPQHLTTRGFCMKYRFADYRAVEWKKD